MSTYTFTFKKDDVFVEFTTTDKETVERQFQIWVADADDYAKQGTGKRKEEKGKRKENTVSQNETDVNSTPHSSPPSGTSGLVSAEAETKIEATTEEFIPIKEQPQPEILDKASTLLKTINTIQEETGNGEQETEEENGKFEEENLSIVQPFDRSTHFEEVLEQSIENPTFEPAKTQDKLFLNLINSKSTKDKFHYLIITAYYLSEFEKLQRFSLKQINSKLMQNLSEVIDHTTLQEAINQNFVELVPDLTGISDVAEYKLTLAGEEFFANKI
jgi:hypothetical protein